MKTELLRSNEIYQNRELSWLKFNERVLEVSCSAATPLMERLNFVSIFGSNLDEFFMIRVGSLYYQTLLKTPETDIKGLSPQEQLNQIFAAVKELMPKKDGLYEDVMDDLESRGIKRIHLDKADDAYLKQLEKYFISDVLPLTSPLIIDGRHPFPHLQNKELYVGVSLIPKDGQKGDKGGKPAPRRYGIIPVSAPVERVIFVNDGSNIRFILLEDLVLMFAGKAFKKYKVEEKRIFRVTRNADIDVDDALFDYDIDFRDAMSEIIKRRRRLAPVRLQVQGKECELTRYFAKKLELGADQVFYERSPLDLSFIHTLSAQAKKGADRELFYAPIESVNLLDYMSADDLTEYLKNRDVLLSFPYNTTNAFIKLLQSAADDPHVISIKITLYRLAPNSRIVSALVKAAENGKNVMAVVELRARFDEENNISWSKQMEEAGVTVIYGVPELKVHSKLLQITYKYGREIRYLTQVGTGNYNEETAKLYTDFSLITSNQDIGSEASIVFNNLAIGDVTEHTNHLLVAPKCLKTRVVEMIDREIAHKRAGEEARIIIKANSISDRTIIDKLIEASQEGVPIKLFIRGICCFKPGVPGYTDNITVKSIVGRLLEHSRVYVFGAGDRMSMYISSADFMTRNTQNRVEVAAPIYDEGIRRYILKILDVMDADTVNARVLQESGEYIRVPGEGVNSQLALYDMAREDAKKYAEFAGGRARSRKQEARRRSLFSFFKGNKA